MALKKGFIGSVLKVTAALFLLLGGLKIGVFRELIENYRESIEEAMDTGQLLNVLQMFSTKTMQVLNSVGTPLIITLIAWYLGNKLIEKSWNNIKEPWPKKAKVYSRILGTILLILAIIGLLNPIIMYITGSFEKIIPEQITWFFLNPAFQRIAPYLIVSPMFMPLIKVIIGLKYSSLKHKRALGIVGLGSLVYVLVAAQVYMTYRLGTAIISHARELLHANNIVFDTLKQANLALADTMNVLIDRVENLLIIIVIANILYAIGFLYYDVVDKEKNQQENKQINEKR